jgi:AbrB family looped-hinge helix DNA binding protein
MRQLDTSVTQKGQVTIPVEVRRAMGLQPRDRVRIEFDPERGIATLRRAPTSIQDFYGIARSEGSPPIRPPTRDEIEAAIAQEVMSETE